MTELDHHDHEAMIALNERGEEGLGDASRPRRPATGQGRRRVTVVDEWQGRGLGTLLLEVISARALDEGVGRSTALMLARIQAMMDLFERLGPVRVAGRAAGTVEIEVAIPGVEVAPELRELLRRARRHGAAAPR
jgi:GNAT superfamily N-acetyltransferase